MNIHILLVWNIEFQQDLVESLVTHCTKHYNSLYTWSIAFRFLINIYSASSSDVCVKSVHLEIWMLPKQIYINLETIWQTLHQSRVWSEAAFWILLLLAKCTRFFLDHERCKKILVAVLQFYPVSKDTNHKLLYQIQNDLNEHKFQNTKQ